MFITLARLSAGLLEPWVPEDAARAALAMSLLAGLAGTFALFALYRVLRLLEGDPVSSHDDAGTGASPRVPLSVPLLATALAGVSPLFWVTASRPLSDMPGLAGALGCHWLIVGVLGQASPLRGALIAAFASGVASGLRSQVTWLVAPLLAWLVAHIWGRLGPRRAMAVAAAALAGGLTWAVPMMAITGGVDAYIDVLARQAGEDITGVPMLALRPGLAALVTACIDTFVHPWTGWWLAVPVLALALLGVFAVRTRQRTIAWAIGAFGPYVVYHLLFQETETTRYALPIIPAIASLAVLAGRQWMPRVATGACLLVIAMSGVVSVQAHRQYVDTPVASQAVVRRFDVAARGEAGRPTVVMHRRVWAETRRIREALDPSPAYDVMPSPRDHEWQQLGPAWERSGAVWWLVDPRRGDLRAVDPRSLGDPVPVAWPMPVASLLGGMRPHAFLWYRPRRPQWLLGDGWGLSPELAGLSAAARQGPSTSGADAYLLATGQPSTLLIGGRHIGMPDAAPVTLDVRVGDAWRQQVTVRPGNFAFTWALPAEATATTWTPLRVTSTRPGPETILLEQFDRQPVEVPITALEDGWFEPERDPASGRQWRWVSDTSALRVVNVGAGDVQLDVRGTYPRHYRDAPTLDIHIGATLVSSQRLPRPFRIVQRLDGDVLRRAAGRVTWRVSRSFVAGALTGSADARRLALEIGSLRVDAVR